MKTEFENEINTDKKNKLSVIIPVYFNQDNLIPLYSALIKVLISDKFDYEIVFVDDGSKDNSYAVIKKLMQEDKNIKTIKLSKNFGSHSAILAGMINATGDCVTVVAADLQEPPELILDMYEKYVEGNDIVIAIREGREDSYATKFFANTYYTLMQKLALSNMPTGGFDSFLLDKKVVNVLENMQEKNSSIVGQILWCGFKTAEVKYVRRQRKIGKSKWTLSKKIKLFIDSFISFSYFPIRFMSAFGIMLSFISIIWMSVILYYRLVYGQEVKGWASLIILFLFISGIQLIMNGIIGEYLWRTLDETRKRPLFIIDKKEGFDND